MVVRILAIRCSSKVNQPYLLLCILSGYSGLFVLHSCIYAYIDVQVN